LVRLERCPEDRRKVHCWITEGDLALLAGAVSTHWSAGFFMNWFGQLGPGVEGFEYLLLVIAMAVAIVIRGSGAASLDRMLVRRGH